MATGSSVLVELFQLDPEVEPRSNDSSETRLLQTILHDAIEDAINMRRGRERTTITASARDWIFGEPDQEKPRRWELGDFEPLCWALDIDPSAVRKLVRDTIEGRVVRQRRCRLTTVRVRGAAA